MKGWLHLLAALAGIGVALLIVLAVFGAADREGSTAGDKPPPGLTVAGNTGSTGDCGTIPLAATGSPGSVAKALAVLPAIYNAKQQQVTIQDAGQRAWFARLHASLGLCTEEIDVYANQISVSAVVTNRVTSALQNGYALGFLAAAFSPPLNRSITQLRLVRPDGSEAHVLTTQSAYRAFVVQHAKLHLPDTILGLAAFGRKAGYKSTELKITGFT